MGYAKHVGRVGALAVALGVGTAIAGSAGTAWAEPAEKAATSAATDSDPAQTADNPVADAVTAEPTPQPETAGPTADLTAPPTSVPAEETTQSRVEVVPGVVVAHSGGAQDSTYGSASNNDAPPKNSNKPNTVKAAPASTTASPPAPAESSTERAVAPKVAEVSAPAVVSTAVAEVVTSPPGLAAEPRTAVVSTAVHPVWNALAAIFGSGPGPKTPSQTPLSWVLAAAARREVGDVAFARTTALAGAANQPPTTPVVTVNNPNASTGVVTGTAVSTDPDGDTVTYRVPATTTKGAVTITAAGAFTYTPTAAARHAAAAITAPASDKQDTFTVTVSDGYGGTTTAPVTVNILGRNTAPGGWANVGWPNTTTGVTTGTISASDADYDALRYSAANTTKGTVTVTTTGAWTYTPTTAARHAAAAIGAPASAKQDTITLTVSDGYGGTTNIPVTLTIIPKNTAPTNPIATVGNPNPATGVVTGTVRATDADGDTLSYTTPAATSKGAVTITGTGDFTYTPTAAARRAAAAVNAPASAKTDTFTVTITDGHGGSTTKAVTVTVAPRANQPPTTPVVTVNNPNASTGVVTGTAVSTDPDGDTVTYRVP
ncbi:Ig-like domain-containing protein, partial [Mycolicibacterium arenosum]